MYVPQAQPEKKEKKREDLSRLAHARIPGKQTRGGGCQGGKHCSVALIGANDLCGVTNAVRTSRNDPNLTTCRYIYTVCFKVKKRKGRWPNPWILARLSSVK